MKLIRSIFILTLLCLTIPQGFGQGRGEANPDNIALHVIVPDQTEEYFTDRIRDRLETKMHQIASNYGLSGEKPNPRFVLASRVDLVSYDQMSSAPVKILAKMEVTLFVAGYQSKLRFGNEIITVAGVGRTQEEAHYKAISSLKTRTNKLEEFLDRSKRKIVEYYEDQCKNIMAEAERYIQTQDFESAIALLMTVPVEAGSCFRKTQDLAIEAYERYIEKDCQQLLLAAKSAAAVRNYGHAAAMLASIDTNTECASQTQGVIAEISSRVAAEDQRQWDAYLIRLQTQSEMQGFMLDALRDIATSRYRQYVTPSEYIIRH